MAKSNNTLCLDKFYPEKDLIITDIDQQSDKIIVQMKSTSSSCKCPKCICESNIRRITRCNAGGRPISFTSESTGNNKKSSESRNPCNNKYPTQ